MLAGIRRALLILATISAPTAVFSLLLGLGLGTPVSRSLATGFYIVGSVLMLVGVLAGVRGPLRTMEAPSDAAAPASLFGLGGGPRRVRKATDEERRDAVSTTLLFLVLGLVLVAFGVVADAETELL